MDAAALPGLKQTLLPDAVVKELGYFHCLMVSLVPLQPSFAIIHLGVVCWM